MAAELARDLEAREIVDLAPRRSRARQLRYWSALWPQLLALLVAVALLQVVGWSGWRSASEPPPPRPVFHRPLNHPTSVNFFIGVATTLLRAGSRVWVAVASGT